MSSRLSGRLIDFVTLLVLARVLSPADFGLTALAASLVAILDTATEIPISQALTRLKAIDKSHLDTAFTLALLRGCVLSSALLAAAWPFSLLFHDHRLAAIVCTLAVGPVAKGLYSPAMVRYVRQISFRQLFTTEIIGKLLAAGCALYLATHGARYWAIAANSVIWPVTAGCATYFMAPYRPRPSLARLADFSGFIGWLSGAQLLSAASYQVDRGVLGYFVTKATVGRYTVASDVSLLPTQTLVGPALQSVMAAFARIADEPERLRKAYLRATQYAMVAAAPAGVGISVTADLVVRVLLGQKWLESIFYLKWLALAAVLHVLYQPFYVLAIVLNRPFLVFRTASVEICCKIVFVALGYMAWKLPGVLVARGAIALIMFTVVLFTVRKLVGVALVAQLANLWRIALAAAVMAAVVSVFVHHLATVGLAVPIKLGLAAALGAVTYAGALFGLGFRIPELSRERRIAGRAFSV